MSARAGRHRAIAPLVRMALAGATGDAAGVRRAVGAARRAGWPRTALEEIGLMLALYAGHAAAIETLRALAAAWPGRARPREVPVARRAAAGAATLAAVYGPVTASLRRALGGLHPALERWIVEHAYGRVLARRALGLRERELVTVALLAQGRWDRQLAGHLVGARRAGAPAGEIAAARRMGERSAAPRRGPGGRGTAR